MSVRGKSVTVSVRLNSWFLTALDELRGPHRWRPGELEERGRVLKRLIREAFHRHQAEAVEDLKRKTGQLGAVRSEASYDSPAKRKTAAAADREADE